MEEQQDVRWLQRFSNYEKTARDIVQLIVETYYDLFLSFEQEMKGIQSQA